MSLTVAMCVYGGVLSVVLVDVGADLGEMSLWFGLFLSCSAAFSRSSHYLAIAGPCFNTFLLLFVSGVPLLENSSDKKSPSTAGKALLICRLPLDELAADCYVCGCVLVAGRYGSDPRYQQYKKNTPVLIPNISHLLGSSSK